MKGFTKKCKYIHNKYKRKAKQVHEGIDTRIMKTEETEQSSDSVGDPSDNDNTADVEAKTSIEPIDELCNASLGGNTCNAADHQIVESTNANTFGTCVPVKGDATEDAVGVVDLPQPKKKGRPRKACVSQVGSTHS